MTDKDLVRGLRERLRLQLWALARVPLALIGIPLIPLQLIPYPFLLITIGFPLLVATNALNRKYSDVHRAWAGRALGEPIPRPYRRPPTRGLVSRVRTTVTDPATWRELAWLPLNAVLTLVTAVVPLSLWIGGVLGLVTPVVWMLGEEGFDYSGLTPDVPFGFALAPVIGGLYLALAWRLTPWATRTHARVARWLLAPTARTTLSTRVQELAESRADTVDAQAAELRRIERDLHDGAQARLVALGMSLGMAEDLLSRDPEAARALLTEARESSTLALSELRDLVRGIHPPVLSDRGLDGAVRALGLALPLPVDVDIELGGRPQAPVESAVYFAVAETLANVAKHSGASSAWIRVRHADGRLSVMVGDDGRGGAEIVTGGGLRGTERRLAAFDGTLGLASPVGGPTIVTLELPCELSSVKTSSSSGTA
ncbi:sensor domain-containing protein [Umezawaea sp. Da 62-37]|uniref:sensor histidine kinase n=1 Tax=Umezawaea sp. Da 62-37 TaxID=3075927 RepID=UPI0028F6C429|nr:sensor domain-containing protein [Umezawaea sp. Da 62-37]WNV82321.1 sensor domain-containing protein [Umezawaea sp. Da 62-37]